MVYASRRVASISVKVFVDVVLGGSPASRMNATCSGPTAVIV